MNNEKRLVMVVDDEEDFTFFLKASLERLGCYEVIMVNEGRKAFAQAKRSMPDAILLDITMPGSSGLDVLEKLKRDPKTTSIPVIMLTARTDEESKARATSLYNEDYLNKPIDLESLRDSIDRLTLGSASVPSEK